MEQSRRDFFVKSVKTALGLSILSGSNTLDGHPAIETSQKTKSIPTMNGLVSTENLGVTLIHEHLLFGDIPKEKEKESIDFAVNLLKEAERVAKMAKLLKMPP